MELKQFLEEISILSIDVINNLNLYEKLLIQRVKPFQTVQKLENVGKKNIPHYANIDKLVRRTIHFPLPIQENINRICPDNVAINLNQELIIQVRGIPTKKNIIWEDLVNVNSILEALTWLKENNIHYEDIELPDDSSSLIEEIRKNVPLLVEYNGDDENLNNDACSININDMIDEARKEVENNKHNVEKQAMLTLKLPTDEFYEAYTIVPMYSSKPNEPDKQLYQMKRIIDEPLNFQAIDVDCKSFPDLFPNGIFGQNYERDKKLRACDFIKCKITSKHSQCR